MRDHPHAFALGVCFGMVGGAVGTVGLAWLIAATKLQQIINGR